MTKKYKKIFTICRIISILLVLVPIFIYTIKGFIDGTTAQKVTLGLSLTLSLIFVIINVIAKHRIRSTIWVMLIGIYASVSNIIPLLIIIAVDTIIDEFVLEPLYKHYKQKYTINKEIDNRIGE